MLISFNNKLHYFNIYRLK